MVSLIEYLLPYQRRFVHAPQRHKFFLCTRQGGKSFASSYIATHEALLRDGSLVLVISTGARAAQEWLHKAAQFADAVRVLTDGKITYTSTADRVEFSNGSKVISLPSGNPAGLRGYTAQCVIIDECFFIEHPDEVLAAINPTLTRSADSKFILCSTPGSKASPFFELLERAKNDPAWYVQTTTIHDCIADGLAVDIEQLRQLCPDPTTFSVEYECQFCDGVGQLIDSSLIQYYADERKFDEYFIGADWARTSDGTAFAVVGRDRGGVCHLCDLVNLHCVEYAKQTALAAELFRRYNPRAMYGDAGGLGSPLMEQLHRTVNARIKPYTFSASNKGDAYEYFRKQVFDRRLLIKEDYRSMLLEDLSLMQQVISDTGKITYVSRRHNGSHADNLCALVLALQAERDNRANATAPQTFAFPSRIGSFSRRF